MPTPVFIPKATITMEGANIIGWRKLEGDAVAKDEMLFEMETDKVVVEVPAMESGLLLRIDVREGKARLDQPIAWIGQLGDAIPAAGAARETAPVAVVAPPLAVAAEGSAGAVPSTPAARRRARELGIDLASLQGTGPGGRITESDVDRAAGAK